MGKKRNVKPWRAAAEQIAQPNAFERIYNRKKFDVLGKKQKGERKQGKARSDAVTKRKGTLLVEYRGMQKSNAFVDQRFGEDDSSLTAGDKAIARFQKQRMKELEDEAPIRSFACAGDKFALLDDDEEQLTHMGKSLAADDFQLEGDRQLWGDDEDDDAGLDDSIVRDFHFGGGFIQKRRSTEDDGAGEQPAEAPKSKKEVMEELIAKSKAGKAAKAMQKEADLTATDVLDASFESLLRAGDLSALMKEKGAKHARVGGQASQDPGDEDAEFDRMRRELAFESRAKGASGWLQQGSAGQESHKDSMKRRAEVSDRTKTPEELAELERARLEALEKQRLKRMTAAADAEAREGEEPAGEPALATGGYAARRQKRQKLVLDAENGPSGDALDENFELSGDEEDEEDDEEGSAEDGDSEGDAELNATDAKRAAQAAGDHPLQQNFQAAASELLKKYGVATDDAGEQSEDREQSEEDDEEGESEDEEAEDGVEGPAEAESDEGSKDEGENRPEVETQAQVHAQEQQEVARAASGHEAGTSGRTQEAPSQDLAYSIEAPESYEQFARLVAGRSAMDLSTAIQRIMACSAVALAAQNRRKLQVLYGILVQHFARLAGQAPLPIAHLDALAAQLLDLTAEVPFYAATVARARLSRLQERLDAALSDSGSDESPWPTTRGLLLLKLWVLLFPISDRRHPVLTPAAILVSAHLALCRLTCAMDIARGLFLSSLALHMAAPGRRYVPEPLNFAVRVLESVSASSQAPLAHSSNPPFTTAADWLKLGGTEQAADSASEGLLSMYEVLAREPGDAYFGTRGFQCSAITAAVEVVDRAADLCADLAALPEILAPAQRALAHLTGLNKLPESLAMRAREVLRALASAAELQTAARKPLTRRSATKAPEIKLLNPRFEEEYAAGKDYDPDRERSEAKRLRRQLQKERRGAMRELRKDAAFLGEVRDRDKAAAGAERRAGMRANMAFLEQQEADFKSGGQGGMGKFGKKRRR